MSKAEEARKRAEREIARAEKEDAILADLPPGLPWRVFAHPLYGSVARVSLRPSGRYGDEFAPDLALAARVAETLAPVPITLVRDGCLSFRPTRYVNSLPESAKERWDEEREGIQPVLLDLDPGTAHGRPTATLQWYAETPAGVVNVHVEMPMPWDGGFGRVETRWREGRGYRHVESCRYSPAAWMLNILRPDGECVAILASPIKWASGGPEYPNRWTCYWEHLGGNGMSAGDLLYSKTRS